MVMNGSVSLPFVIRDCLNCSVVNKTDCENLNATVTAVSRLSFKACTEVICCNSTTCNTQTPAVPTQPTPSTMPGNSTSPVTTKKAGNAASSFVPFHGLVVVSLIFNVIRLYIEV